MIRVGFVMSFHDQSWTGGANYYKNLIKSVANRASARVQPVIFTDFDAPISVESQFPGVEIVRSDRVSSKGWRWKASKISQRIFGRDALMEAFFRSHHIDVISHSGHLGPKSRLPTIGWIPDFQHIRMPEFFSAEERATRDARFVRLCNWCTLVIVSSLDAQEDLRKFMPSAYKKSRVLQFVSGLDHDGPKPRPLQELKSDYEIAGPYFHVPNQFWVHKNHQIIIQALAKLKSQGRYIQVFATGNPKDRRQAGHFDRLMQSASDLGVTDMFKVLGLVPYQDLRSLMQNAVAIVNPSRFEGWSTSVEEAKSLGKRIIISDIPVHREQSPERALYFDPDSSDQLAEAFLKCLAEFCHDKEMAANDLANNSFNGRIKKFVSAYEDIASEALIFLP